MKISKDDVVYIAKLAKLRFSDEEIEKLTGEFESILSHFQSIDRMDLENVDPDEFADRREPVFRADENTIFGDRDKLFRNAGSMRGTFIQVPRILE
ncbi:MAG TPA: Asp-tRNA(Asn)/Glu-tRNA(Gln) amidotransferase subunit GatC [Clostridia bacterium]